MEEAAKRGGGKGRSIILNWHLLFIVQRRFGIKVAVASMASTLKTRLRHQDDPPLSTRQNLLKETKMADLFTFFFFQQPVRDNFPNWIRFKFDASFWLAAIETTDENCNPLPPPTSLPATAPTAPTATIRQSMPLDWINWIENSLAMGFCDDLDSFD